ncbi:high affinity immunoglobulin epsilon receptor subunit alpha-like [Morone saxatilis]|uniref:high affinity immunoglobulin epsilon receptor subunit alpha-like n=1 Tax=Morone saxatilis TaxID=34816 RepID=UPI0015E1BAE9|nr:high affinity immunoglobulin epsilon receptor subunit alpha-like [Morone saxatilis]
MEVRALCIRLVGITLLLLVAHVHLSDSQKTVAAFPKVAPNRQQHFQYESIVVSCEGLEGLTGWRVMKKIKEVFLTCASTSAGPCEITNTFSIDSGEYWCEHQDVKRSNTVNITVTAGSVILESPVLPVMEGEAVNLSCRNKMASGNLIADFFKDGVHIRTSVTGALPIHSVSKSDEGLYKCNISGAGESPESWMTVKVFGSLHEDSHPSHDCSPHGFIVLRIFGTILLFALGLAMGLQPLRYLPSMLSLLNEPVTDSRVTCLKAEGKVLVEGLL